MLFVFFFVLHAVDCKYETTAAACNRRANGLRGVTAAVDGINDTRPYGVIPATDKRLRYKFY